MAAEGMTTTSNTGSPLVVMTKGKRKKKPPKDVENAADARMPGDKAEDMAFKSLTKKR